MSLFTILRDNREQKPWSFDDFEVDTEDVTLNTGDYTLAEFCDYDDKNDTYLPNFAIERKAGKDFISSITHSRDRFRDEIKRTSDWDRELLVLIESPESLFRRQRGFMSRRDVSPSQIFGTVREWEKYYNVDFRFVGTRECGMEKTFEVLSNRLFSRLLSG